MMTPSDHLSDLFHKEIKHYSTPIKHTITHSIRIQCIQWIQSAIQTSRTILQKYIHPSKSNALQRHQVLYLAISLLDRFFNKVQPIHPSKLLLLSAACLWVASKLEDLHPVSASFLAQQLPFQYPISQTKKLLVQFESMVLCKLEYHLDVTHPFNFAYSFLTLIPAPAPPRLQEILFVACKSPYWPVTRPSVVGLSCSLLSVWIDMSIDERVLRDRVVQYVHMMEGYSPDIVGFLHHVVEVYQQHIPPHVYSSLSQLTLVLESI